MLSTESSCSRLASLHRGVACPPYLAAPIRTTTISPTSLCVHPLVVKQVFEIAQDSTVWARGSEKPVKGALAAAREVAAELETDAAKAVEVSRLFLPCPESNRRQVATTSGCAPGHPPSIAASRPRLDVFGRPIHYDALDEGGSSTASGPANGKTNGEAASNDATDAGMSEHAQD